MIEIISALWPVFALILLGYLSQYIGFPNQVFWQQAEKGTYFVLFPILLVRKLSTADMSGVDLYSVGLSVLGLVLAGSLVAFICRPFISGGASGFTSFYQGSVRFNTYVGLAASAALFGDESLALAAVIIAFMIPLLNLCCVLVFSIFTHKGGGITSTLAAIIKNPLIMACLVGLALNQSGIGLPEHITSVADLIAQMALPMGLLAVGAALSFRVMLEARREVMLSSVLKLLIFPCIALGVAGLLSLSSEVTQLLILFASLPTATSAYILSRQLGGDSEMMSAIITGQTLLAMLTMPLVLKVMI